ncbi:MAG TPA: phosphatase PAP2 family protein [Candidatus Bathyarchaeia archaeon]|nr:phosphatase PAP2 family protein [Candidatus Bathyarchaeia archaeon]
MSLVDLLFGTELIRFLQGLLAPDFNRFFRPVTLLGEPSILLGLSAVTYWCLDKRRGRIVTYVILCGAWLDMILKPMVHSPRPPSQLRIVSRNDTSYGFPSEHAQSASSFWAFLSIDMKSLRTSIVGFVIVLVVCLSRLYLGVHYPIQVIGGVLIGIIIAAFSSALAKRTVAGRMKLLPPILFAVGALLMLAVSQWMGLMVGGSAMEISGYLFAFSLGTILEDKIIGFTTQVSLERKIARVMIGGLIMGALIIALGILSTNLVFVNSAILGLTVVFIVPYIFEKLEQRWSIDKH